MTRKNGQAKSKRQKRFEIDTPGATHSHYESRTAIQPVKPLNPNQDKYFKSIQTNTLTWGIGPAGVGKTFICGALSADALTQEHTSQIILTRPGQEAGEEWGALPGTIEEKYEPFIQPFRQIFEKRMGVSQFKYELERSKRIRAIPLGFMRGLTFDDCWVILDEAQNATPVQMKMFLTRIGKNCKVIINGDPDQTDLVDKRGQPVRSGLVDAMERFSTLNDSRMIFFTEEDCVRSKLVKDILAAYSNKDRGAFDKNSASLFQ